ncbi:DUF2911 domain-containing protein [Halalkalibaculum sp. DA3122]|uniref:DUF2911 domain-containing protein n=1 Tax=unclassified Halalkalibaculum TaxID=2964617 RepID=UPI003754B532
MKKSSVAFAFTFLFLISVSCQEEPAQTDTDRRKSPIAIAKVDHNNTYIKIVYGQPYKRGRTIFGDLVPYNEVWRTGANEATELTTTRDIVLADKKVEAGTYALFTIPGKEQWTLILNGELGQWGAFDYNAEYDILRVDVNSEQVEDAAEAFSIQFGEVQNDSTSITIRWDRTRVNIPVAFLNQDHSTGNAAS